MGFILIGLMLASVFAGAVSAIENSVKSADDNGSVELPVVASQNPLARDVMKKGFSAEALSGSNGGFASNGTFLKIGIDRYAHYGDYDIGYGFQYPHGYEHAAVAWWGEGFTLGHLCNDSEFVAYSYESDGSFGLTLVSETVVKDTEDEAIYETVLRSADGRVELVHNFRFLKETKFVVLTVTITNVNTTDTLNEVRYRRVWDFDMDNSVDGSDGFNVDMSRNMLYAWESHYAALASSSTTPPTEWDINAWDDLYTRLPGTSVYTGPFPVFGDYCVRFEWVYDSIAPGDSVTITMYHIGGDNKDDLDASYDFAESIVSPPGVEKSFAESSLIEDLSVKKATLDNVTVSGDFTSTLNFTEFEIVNITTGSFAGKGFSKGKWETTLGGTPYKGDWKGAIFLKPREERIYLKGATTGEISGTVEGYLTESVPGSGIYDQYRATWKIGRIGITTTSAIVNLNGTLAYQESSEFLATELYILQTSMEGNVSGHYSGPLSTLLTHLRVVNESNPYYGEGFSIISYVSETGSGEGWTYDKLVSPGRVELKGLFTSPLFGIASGILDESKLPRTLIVRVERVDLGLPPMADLGVRVWGPTRVSPGQTIDYIVEYRNNGVKSAENVVVVSQLPYLADYISSTGGGIYYAKEHQTFWKLGTVKAGEGGFLSVKVRYYWGLELGEEHEIFALIGTSSPSRHANLPDIKKYLTYEPLKIVHAEVLPTSSIPSELAIELSDPNINDLYDYANELGFNYTKTVTRLTFSDGSKFIWIMVMNESDFNESPIFITKFTNEVGNKSFLIKFTNDTMLFFNETGGMSYDFINSSYTGWGTWNISGSPNYWQCVRNGVNEKVPGWALSESTNLLSGGWAIAAKLALALPDCGGCVWDLFSERELTTECASCLSNGIKSIPAAGEITDISGILADCIDPNTYACDPGTTKEICAIDRGLWYRLTDFPQASYTMRCNDRGVWEEDGYTICDLSPLWGGPCPEGKGKCIEGGCVCDPPTHKSQIAVARDPNIKYGPEGYVLAGQTLNYTVEYENEGEGIAFGVYFTDVLDEDLDDSTLEIGPVISTIDGSVIAPAGTYNPSTRTITWLVGEVGPGEGGYANLSVNVKGNVSGGTEIINFATVYFPSVPETTRTNGIVSFVFFSIETATGTGTAYFAPDAGSIEDLIGLNESALPEENPNVDFPHGLFSFNITGLNPNQTVNITIAFPQDIPATAQYWKYGPNGSINNPQPERWYQIPIGSNDGDNIITITLQDGGIGDDDGVANGIIVDQGGPGIPTAVARVPTLTSIGIIALVGLLSVIAISKIRRRWK